MFLPLFLVTIISDTLISINQTAFYLMNFSIQDNIVEISRLFKFNITINRWTTPASEIENLSIVVSAMKQSRSKEV